MSGILALLRISDIRTLLIARFISMFGSAATVLAVQLLVLDLTDSTAALGLTAVLVETRALKTCFDLAEPLSDQQKGGRCCPWRNRRGRGGSSTPFALTLRNGNTTTHVDRHGHRIGRRRGNGDGIQEPHRGGGWSLRGCGECSA
jgi:hypothetical protein